MKRATKTTVADWLRFDAHKHTHGFKLHYSLCGCVCVCVCACFVLICAFHNSELIWSLWSILKATLFSVSAEYQACSGLRPLMKTVMSCFLLCFFTSFITRAQRAVKAALILCSSCTQHILRRHCGLQTCAILTWERDTHSHCRRFPAEKQLYWSVTSNALLSAHEGLCRYL